jgi:hypothetical protein
MSKKINVNPDYYTLAGRERPGNAAAKAPKAMADDEAARVRWQERQGKKARVKREK